MLIKDKAKFKEEIMEIHMSKSNNLWDLDISEENNDNIKLIATLILLPKAIVREMID